MTDTVILGANSWYTGPDAAVAGLYLPSGAVSPTLVTTTYANALLNYPAATNSGRIIRVSDLDNILLQSNGTRYKPLGRSAIIGSLDADWTGAASASEQIGFSKLLPAALLATGDRLRMWVSVGKNNTAENFGFRIRFGTAGTTADTTLLGSVNVLTSTALSNGFFVIFRREAATSERKMGTGVNLTTYMGAANTGAVASAITVSNMDSNPMYLTMTAQMSVGAETPIINDVVVEWLAAAA